MHTEQKHHAIKALKDLNYSSRAIAKMVLGDASKKSTVNDYLKKINSIPAWPFYDQLILSNKAENCFSDIADDLGYYSKKVYKDEVNKEYYKGFAYKWDKVEHQNQRILNISDMHLPFQHPDTFEFLQHLKDKYNPTRVICGGDEVDAHALSFHNSDPDLPSAGDELKQALPLIAKLHKMFPEMSIIGSNHSSMIFRKAMAHGLPRAYLKNYNEFLNVGSGWKWTDDLTVDLPDGTKCYYHHGKINDVLKLSQTMGMSAVQFHFHENLSIKYWANPNGIFFALQSGCLVDDKAYAFNYNNVNLKRPLVATSLIIDSLPVLEPMVLDTKGRWIGRAK